MKIVCRYVALVALVVFLSALRWPQLMALEIFAHGDPGSVLTGAKLTAVGMAPGVDFVYPYGLGAIAVADVVLSIFGFSPTTYTLTCIVLAAVYAAAIGWALTPIGINGAIMVVVAAGVALGIPLPSPNFVHLLEPILLSIAVGLHARKLPEAALCLVTATAFFVKPGLGYFYGLMLVLESIIATIRDDMPRWRTLFRRLLPATITGLTLGLILVARYGIRAVATTMLPTTGMSVYAHDSSGFFENGRQFWMPMGRSWKYYLGTPVGFWLVATGLLMCFACFLLVKRINRVPESSVAERLVVICGFLHGVFVLMIFGPPTSWFYDFNLLVIGVAATVTIASRFRFGNWFMWGLLVSAIFGNYTGARHAAEIWKTWIEVPGTDRLYAAPGFAEEWLRLGKLAERDRVYVLNFYGASSLLNSHLLSPESWSFWWWCAPEAEVRRGLDGIRRSRIVAVPRYLGFDEASTHPAKGPPFDAELRRFPIVEIWKGYRILRATKSDPWP